MIIKRQIKMYNITIHIAQHLCRVENVAKHSVRYNGVLHFDPASLRLKCPKLNVIEDMLTFLVETSD